MSLFRLDASIRVDGSHSSQVAELVESEWRAVNPSEPVVRRQLAVDPIPSTAWADAVAAGSTPDPERSPQQRAALALAAEATDQLLSAEALLFAVPLYNFGVSQHFKTWVDLIFTDPRMAPGGPALLADKPAALVVVRGGSYAPGTPREGWDHSTGWVRRILQDVWQLNLHVVEKEFTLVGVNPALEEFRDLAAGLHAEADELARKHGRSLANAASV